MADYYLEILSSIEDLIDDGKMEEANLILSNELKMPYIPKDVEERLLDLKTRLDLSNKGQDIKTLSIEEIEAYLFKKDKEQLIGVDALSKKNIRSHLDLVDKFFMSKPNREAAALLIDILIEQEINEEFEYIKDGINYSFIPALLTRPEKSRGLLEAIKYIDTWVLSDNPSMHKMCLQVLIHEAYLYLPLEYGLDEAMPLALGVIKKVSALLDDLESFRTICSKYSLNPSKILDIMS